MHIMRKDIKKNRLYITLSGIISLNEAAELKDLIIKEIEELQPGFDVVNNLSKYIQGDERAAPILQGVTKYLILKKVNRLVRVVGTSKTGLMQFAKFANPTDSVDIHYFPTMKEAEEFLDRV